MIHPFRCGRRVLAVGCLIGLAQAQAAADAEHACVVEPSRTAEIRAPSPGLISRIRATRGEMVKAGQVLVELDAGLEQAAADAARQRATMEGAERVAAARLEYAKLKAQRQQELAAQNFSSQNDRDAAVAELRVASAEFVEAQENRRLADLEHRRFLESVRQRTLKAPFDAVVVERLAQPGEVALTTDSARPLLKLADIATLHVEALFPAALWPRVKVGQSMQVRFEGAVGGTHVATLSVVDRVLDPASLTFGARLVIPNPQLKLPAGVRCKVRL